MSANVPLSDKAYESIRAEVLAAGSAAFGGRLGEQQLAEHMHMSRTPVRSALRRLAAAGLVEERGGRYVPRRPRIRDIREQYELRVLLEGRAAELAAVRPADDLERELRQADVHAGVEFHVTVASASGNAPLARSIATLNERSFMLRRPGGCTDAEREQLRAGHSAVLDALRAGASVVAARAMADHLALGRDLSIAAVRALRLNEGERA